MAQDSHAGQGSAEGVGLVNWIRRFFYPEREYLYEPSRFHTDYGNDIARAAKSPEYWTKRDGETLRGIKQPEPVKIVRLPERSGTG